MALYASDGEQIVSAFDGNPHANYWCLECDLPVKLRRARRRLPHFYHLQLSPSCRLYSKSEDHLLLQLQLQSLFPQGEAHIERTFPDLRRISDVVWEKEKIAFEIQCSQIFPLEVTRRVEEYKSAGYQVVWLLDDRVYNKRILRPAETLMRQQVGYFISFHRHQPSLFYDQFEVLSERRRHLKGRPLAIQLLRPRLFPPLEIPLTWPLQIQKKIATHTPFFPGDRLDRALKSSIYPSYAFTLDKWAMLEKKFRRNPILEWWKKWIAKPISKRLDLWITHWH
ncbi:MAG: hypothetical protein HY069_03870 [Chlamydiia bacterium]|nr:hypothetical protein [Chlamydiia bacterium]